MFIGIIPGFIKLFHIKIGVVGRFAKCTPLIHPINALTYSLVKHFCLFVLGFNGPVNNEVMSSRSVDSGTVPGKA